MTNKDFDEARSDFEQVLQIDANNKAAKNQLTVCAAKQKEQLQRERQMYKNMFERMAAKDAPVSTVSTLRWSASKSWEPSWPYYDARLEANIPPLIRKLTA